MRYERSTEPGRVRPSVMRRIEVPNTGSVIADPAGPRAGSAGFAYVCRSVTARYGHVAVGVPATAGGGGGGGGSIGGVAACVTLACVSDAPTAYSVVSSASG